MKILLDFRVPPKDWAFIRVITHRDATTTNYKALKIGPFTMGVSFD